MIQPVNSPALSAEFTFPEKKQLIKVIVVFVTFW